MKTGRYSQGPLFTEQLVDPAGLFQVETFAQQRPDSEIPA